MLAPLKRTTPFLFALLASTSALHASVPALPVINTNNVFNITNAPFSAVGDGLTINTAAIQSAINAAAAAPGGGTVEIPGPGTFLCGPIFFKSKVNLQVDAGATLQFVPYPAYNGAVSPLGATNLTDIEISGTGTIDGQGATWWAQSTRPVMIFFTRCVRVLIQDVTLQNPPKMHVAFKNAAGEITIQRVTIATTDDSPNTDGIDLIGTNCLIRNCYISTGDDNIAVGSSAAGAFCANILITNCVFGYGHGVSIGSNTQGGVSNMTVINCTFTNTDNGIRMKSDNASSGGSGQGGLAQNLYYYNINMTNVGVPIFVYSYYTSYGSPSASITPQVAAAMSAPTPVPPTTAIWRNIVISNLHSTYTGGSSKLMLWGRKELWITNFTLMNSVIDTSVPFRIFNATGVTLVDSQINVPPGASSTFTLFNAGFALSNSTPAVAPLVMDGLAGTNSLALFNASAATSDSAALGATPISLASCALAISNNLTLPASSVVNFGLGTNASTINVSGSLTLNNTLNFTDAGGFGGGAFTLFSYGGTLGGAPAIGAAPDGFSYLLDSSTPGFLKLNVLPKPISAWGYDGLGQCDVLPILTNVVAVAAGGFHSLALRPDGTVAAWGDDWNGQCDVPAGLSNVIAVAAGAYYSLALRSNGTVVAWGDDTSGQLEVPAAATNVVAISAGDTHCLALRADGVVVAWGDDSWGQADVPARATNILAIAAGGQHSLALRADSTVVAWGCDTGPSGTYAGQADVPWNLGSVVAVAAGGFHSLALRVDGTVIAWGDNSQGQVAVPASVTNVLSIAAGGAHSLAVLPGGRLAAWGENLDGQSDVRTNQSSVVAVAAGAYHSLALTGSSPSAPRFGALARKGKTFNASLSTVRGRVYFLQFKSSLSDSNWTLLTGIVGDGGVRTLKDSGATPSSRFYRLRQQ